MASFTYSGDDSKLSAHDKNSSTPCKNESLTGDIYLPEDRSSRPMLRCSHMVAQHQFFGSLLPEMETQELKQLVRVIQLQGLPHDFRLNEGWCI